MSRMNDDSLQNVNGGKGYQSDRSTEDFKTMAWMVDNGMDTNRAIRLVCGSQSSKEYNATLMDLKLYMKSKNN